MHNKAYPGVNTQILFAMIIIYRLFAFINDTLDYFLSKFVDKMKPFFAKR